MSLEQKYVLFQGLMRTVRKAKEAGVRMQHPEWDDEKVEKELASIYIRYKTNLREPQLRSQATELIETT